jgi:hypothetical protein
MKRDLAAAAELGLSQTAAAEIIEEGIPAQIDDAASRHGVISLTGPLAPTVLSSRGATPLCRCTSPDGHEQADLDIGCAKIVQQLSLVSRIDRSGGLELDDDSAFDK